MLAFKYEFEKDAWANGSYTTESVEGTAQKNAEAIGKVSAYLDLEEAIRGIGVEDDSSPGI